MDRERKVNVEGMSQEELVALSEVLGEHISENITPAVAKVNALMSVYGLKVVFDFQVVPIEEGKSTEPAADPESMVK